MNLSTEHRRALALLGAAARGVPETVLVDGYGFAIELIVDLIRAGYAQADVETVRAGARGRKVAVVRVAITDARRRAVAS